MNIIPIMSLGITVLIQAVVFAYYIGRLFERVAQIEIRISERHSDLEKRCIMHSDVIKEVSREFAEFIRSHRPD